jgi:lysophospholipase L1-like esterase
MSKTLQFACVVALAGLALAAPARAEFQLKDSDRVILLGDAAFGPTFFSEWIDQFIRIKYPDLKTEVICFGSPGDDAAEGNKRLAIEALPLKPTWLILCFGLDAGGQKAFNQARLDTYLEEMRKMIATSRQSGATVIVVTPPPGDDTRNKALANVKYASVIEKYAEALRKLAEEEKVELIDWHAGVANYMKEYEKAPKRPWTKRGIMPNSLSTAIFTDLLLTRWQGEPIQYLITADWNTAEQASASTGSVEVTKPAEGKMEIKVTGAPMALSAIDESAIPAAAWPLTKWCDYKLKIANMPKGGVLISSADSDPKPFLPQQLEEGADMSVVGPLANNGPTKTFRDAIRTKLNQFGRFRSFCHRSAPEPELEEGYKLYHQAEQSLAFGAHKVAYRTPSRFDATFTIEKVDEAMKKAQEQSKTKPIPGPKK